MRKTWFYRLFFSYFPMFICLVSVLILTSFLLLSELSRRETANANAQYVRHIVERIDQSLQEIDSMLIKEMETDEKLRLFFQGNDGDAYFTKYEISKKLNQMISFNPLADSIYLYRDVDRMVFSSNTFLPLASFGDRPFIAQYSAREAVFNLSPKRVYSEFLDQERSAAGVVSLIRQYPMSQGDQGLFVVNISLVHLNRLTEKLSSSGFSFVEIRDGQGQLIAGSRNNGGKDRGTVLSQLHSDYTGWSYTGGVYDDHLFRYVSLFSYAWVGAGIAVMLTGAVWIVYVTRRNYRPIEALMNRIHLHASPRTGKPAAKGTDEFHFIEQAIDSLMERSDTYRKMHEEDSLYRRKIFFMELLNGSRPIDQEQWEAEMERCGLDPRFASMGAAVFEIDKYADLTAKYSYRDVYLLKFILSGVVKETADAANIPVWAEWTAPHQLTALYPLPDEPVSAEQRVMELAESVRAWVQSNLGYTVTVGVGNKADRIETICGAFASAMKALSYKASVGHNRVIAHPDGLQDEAFMDLQLPQISRLAQSFRTGDEDWRPLLEALFRQAMAGRASRDDLVQLLNAVTQQVYRELADFPAEIHDIWRTETSPRLHRLRETFDVAEDAHAEIAQALAELEGRIQDVRESRSHYKLIREVRAYIEREYANPDLSLQLLCDEFGLNGKYVSRLFKESFGEKLVDYVMRVRIENSQRLLEQTSLSMQQIADAVGYTHDISYIRAFKKIVGTTPGDYRKQHGKSP